MAGLLHSYRQGSPTAYGTYALLRRPAKWQAEGLLILQTYVVAICPCHLPNIYSLFIIITAIIILKCLALAMNQILL